MDLPEFAISVRQPWAWAIIHGGKDVENRVKRAITMGGMDKHDRLAVHAATGMTRDEFEAASGFMLRTLGIVCPVPCHLVRGGIIGSVGITGVVKDSDSPWFFGPWALTLIDPVACEPIPSVGQLGAFRWSEADASNLREPLPWMRSWPDCLSGRGARSQSSLFDGERVQ
ncbi:hypothetical protein [Croceicoccus naphthovorans]|uniref:hypothetical protein n=1 Tax=Croceicoccus naphthovorans TaxID=1348774 RepID=UPI00069CFE56|nr:hypothetical protein [Croceicoccus naphthovorans]MBB3991317.1 hypothetical protein [Croceicoccus naphthovorans]